MSIVFIGTVLFSKYMLEEIIKHSVDVAAVITKKESNFNSDFYDLSPICRTYNIPCRYTDNINSEEDVCYIQKLNPDIIVCLGWSNLLKQPLLDIAPVIGFHPSQLPSNRGRHPLIWALALGLDKTASTFFFMDQKADSGDIISQETVPIAYHDNAATLYEKVVHVASKQIKDICEQLKTGSIKSSPQDDGESNTWRKRGQKDGMIDFRMTSRAIYNVVRSLTRPYCGAHLMYNGKSIAVWNAVEKECSNRNIEPGKILNIVGNKLTIKTYDGAIDIVEHEFNDMPTIGEYL